MSRTTHPDACLWGHLASSAGWRLIAGFACRHPLQTRETRRSRLARDDRRPRLWRLAASVLSQDSSRRFTTACAPSRLRSVKRLKTRASTTASMPDTGSPGRLRIDCLETTCSYCRSRGKKTAESRKSRSLMDPSPQQQNWLRIVLRDSTSTAY